MGAVPTGLGSIFLGLPHGLRRGLYHVAPSGLGVWWFRLRLLLEILFLRDEGGVVFRRRRWWWRLVAWVLRWLRMTRCREAFSGGGDGSLLLLHFGFPAGSLGFPAGMVGVAEFGWIDLYSLLIVGA
jgi:hypothetical protein